MTHMQCYYLQSLEASNKKCLDICYLHLQISKIIVLAFARRYLNCSIIAIDGSHYHRLLFRVVINSELTPFSATALCSPFETKLINMRASWLVRTEQRELAIGMIKSREEIRQIINPGRPAGSTTLAHRLTRTA